MPEPSLSYEEYLRLEKAGSLDELYLLLKQFRNLNKITLADAEALYSQFALPMEDRGDVLTLVAPPPIGTPEYLGYMMGSPELVRRRQAQPPVVPPGVVPPSLETLDPEIQKYLQEYTSPKDLATRLANLIVQRLVDKADASSLYDEILGIQPGASFTNALENARIFGLPEVEKAAQEAYDREVLRLKRKADMAIGGTLQEAQQSRQGRAMELTQAIENTQNNPLVTQQDLSFLRQNLENIKTNTGQDITEEFLTGQSDTMMSLLENINIKASERGLREEQSAQAMLAGMNGTKRPARFQRPPLPKMEPIAREFLSETYAPGTRLRSFIEREIPDVAEKEQAEREEWWKRMQPEPRESFEDEQGRIQSEMKRWEDIAAGAPTSEYTGGTYWGTGGLAGIAQKAAEHSRGLLAGLRPEDFPKPEPIKPEEDPFKRALRTKNFKAAYFRQPGAGLASSLTPSIRYR